MSWRTVDPSPFRGWIRWAPRVWPAPAQPHIDLTSHRIVWPAVEPTAGGAAPAEPPEERGVVYLPPATAGDRETSEALAHRCVESGSSVVAHLLAGQPGVGQASHWTDPLAAWLDGTTAADWLRASTVPAHELSVALPLVAGVTPQGDAMTAWIEALAGARPRAVVGIAVELSPADRRRLVESLDDDAFEAVFHGNPPGEWETALALAAGGLSTLPERPRLRGLPPRSDRNRELATALWEAAELAVRLAEPESASAAYFAAARHLESSLLDVAALAREGNLGVLDWLTPAAREVLETSLSGSAGTTLDRLRRRWRSGEAA